MKKEDCIAITSVKIQVGDKNLELTPAELRRLGDVIKDLIGPVPADPVFIPYIQMTYPAWPQPILQEPIWVNPNHEPWPDKWVATCGPLQQMNCLSINAN